MKQPLTSLRHRQREGNCQKPRYKFLLNFQCTIILNIVYQRKKKQFLNIFLKNFLINKIIIIITAMPHLFDFKRKLIIFLILFFNIFFFNLIWHIFLATITFS